MLKSLLSSLILVFIVFAIISCDDTVSSTDEIVFPEEDVSYTMHVQPLLRLTCAYQGCHDSFSQKGLVVLDDYAKMMNSKSGSIVRSGDPENSRLIQVVEEPTLHYDPYVFLGLLNDNHKQGLRTWIEEGAWNN